MTTKPIVLQVTGTFDGQPMTGTLSGDVQVTDPPPPPPPPDPDPPPDPPPEPPPSGVRRVKVTLHPSAAGEHWVSFGLPCPLGTLNEVAAARVFIGQKEVPSFRRTLGPWRKASATGKYAAELLPEGNSPSFAGVRSVLIQFPYKFASTDPVEIEVQLGKEGPSLPVGVSVVDTLQPVSGTRLYPGGEGAWEPRILAVIDPAWLCCSGIHPASGLSDAVPGLAVMDLAQRNYFGTAVADYRTQWDAAPGSWQVEPAQDVDLKASEDGPWLYQRAQSFLALHVRTGWVDPLREFYRSAFHYQSLIWTEADGPGNKWCAGFFKVKNPVATAPYKDPKYTYSEDLFSLYLLTGDDRILPYFKWMSSAQTLGVHNMGWTERFSAYELQAQVIEYEATGSVTALAAARLVVDGLVERSTRKNAAGEVPGCWLGNEEWKELDGFSPWMSPLLMAQLVRYYGVTMDDRVPPMLLRVAACIMKWGVRETAKIGGKTMLVPFYGATTVAPARDLDGDDPWAGIEHAADVAQGLAYAALFATGDVKADILTCITDLMESAEWGWANWTRNAVGRPRYRLAPWRKYNWWFRSAGVLAWLLARPRLGSVGGGSGGAPPLNVANHPVGAP